MVTKASPKEQYVIQTIIWNYRESCAFDLVIVMPKNPWGSKNPQQKAIGKVNDVQLMVVLIY